MRMLMEDVNGAKNYFFLSYDKQDKLNELEVHWGMNILINKIEMEFGKDIKDYLERLKSAGYEYIELEEGNYLFKGLKITIADSESMGGDGNGLSYFYSGQNIDHFVEN